MKNHSLFATFAPWRFVLISCGTRSLYITLDKLFYLVDENKVIIKPIKGDILELRGSIRVGKRPADFNEIRATTQKRVSKKIAEES